MSFTKQNIIFISFVTVISLVFLSLFFISEKEIIKVFSISLFALCLIILGLYFSLKVKSYSTKIKKKLKEIEKLLVDDSLDKLKIIYTEIHANYIKLSEREKQNFYHVVEGIRKKIEEMLKAGKKIEMLLEQSGQGNIKEQHTRYQEMHKHYKVLPKKEQEKYYHHLMHVREKLEGSKK